METQLDIVWERALEHIRKRLNPLTFNTWFRDTSPVAIHEGSFVISAPNKFAKDWLESRHLPMIKTALEAALGEDIDVKITVRKDAAIKVDSANAEAGAAQPPDQHAPGESASIKDASSRKAPSFRFNPRYGFDNFVVGGSNQFAQAAALAVAERPVTSYNPLFIYGGAGLGKTHLMHAIGIHANAIHPEMNVMYVTTEAFTNEFIASIRGSSRNPLPFQKKYRTVDILLIDDIQFIIDKTATQEEFFHIFNTLYEGHKQLVISSDRPPKEMPTLEDRLRSRFEMGLIVDIQPPDLETRIAILQKKAEASGIGVSDDVLQFIAGRRQLNVRELEGALTRISAFADLTNSVIDVSLAKGILKEIFPETRPKRVSTRSILFETAKYFGVSVADLTGKDRSKNISYPRQIAMYLVRELTDASLPKIGDDFGGRDHTTVMHGINKVAASIKKDHEEKIQVQELLNRIKQKDQ